MVLAKTRMMVGPMIGQSLRPQVSASQCTRPDTKSAATNPAANPSVTTSAEPMPRSETISDASETVMAIHAGIALASNTR